MAKTEGIDPADPRQRAFLEKLAHDDEFRDELSRRPREVMDEYGVPYDEDQIPDPVVLQSKEEVQAQLGALEGSGPKHERMCAIPSPVFPPPKPPKPPKTGKHP